MLIRRDAISRTVTVVIVVLVLVVAAVGAYFVFTQNQAPSKVSVKLGIDFAPQGGHAIFFAAAAEGFYNQSGLDVSFIFNNGATAVVQGVDKGLFDFGYTDMGTITVVDSQGGHVKAIGSVVKKNQIATFYLPNSGISSPKDLEGKTLADNAGSSTHVFFPAFASLAGFNASKVNFLNVAFTARNTALLSGQAQAIGGFTGTVLPVLGNRVDYFLWADYGFNVYNNGFLTSDTMIQQHPDIVSRFLKANYEAFAWVSTHPQQAVNDLLKAHPELNATQAAIGLNVQLQSMGDLSVTPVQNIGLFNPAEVNSTVSLTCQYLACSSTVNPSDVYTNQFLQ